MKLHEFFFFLQAHAGIFFSGSISCMNFFLDLTPPLPGYLMVHPLHTDIVQSIKLLIVKLKPNKLIIDYIYRNYGVSFRYVFRIFSKNTVYKMATKSGMTTTVKVVQA